MFNVLLALSAVIPNSARADQITCTLNVPGVEAIEIPSVYDGMNKIFEIPFVIREEGGALNATLLTAPAVMPTLRELTNEFVTEADQRVGTKPVLSKVYGQVVRMSARDRARRAVQVATVRVMTRGGELTPSAPVSMTVRNANTWYTDFADYPFQVALKSDMVQTVSVKVIRADGPLYRVPAEIRCAYQKE